MKKIIALILVSLTLAPLTPLAYCQDEMEENAGLVNSISAEVVSVDVVKGILIVKDTTDKKTEIKILPETQIIKSDKQAKLSDINTADKVIVEYNKNKSNNYTAVNVMVE